MKDLLGNDVPYETPLEKKVLGQNIANTKVESLNTTTSQLGAPTDAQSLTVDTQQEFKKVKASNELDVKRYEASATDKVVSFLQKSYETMNIEEMATAVSDVFTDNEGISNTDKEWVTTMKDSEWVSQYLRAVYAIEPSQNLIDRFRESKNSREGNRIVLRTVAKDAKDKKVNESLGETSQTVATVMGALMSPEVLAGGLVGASVKVGRAIKTAVAVEAGIVIGTPLARRSIDVDYSNEDEAFDLMLGGLFLIPSVAIARSATKKLGEAKAATLAPKDKTPVSDIKIKDDAIEVDSNAIIPDDIQVKPDETVIKTVDNIDEVKLVDTKSLSEDIIKLEKSKSKLADEVSLKKVDKEIKALNKKLSSIKALNRIAKELKTVKENIKKVGNIADEEFAIQLTKEYGKSIGKLASDIKMLSTSKVGDKVKLTDEAVNDIVDILSEGSGLSKAEIAKGLNKETMKFSKKLKIKLVRDKDGDFSLSIADKKTSTKVKVAVAVAVAGSTEGMASDGSDISFSNAAPLVALAVIAGIFGRKKIKDLGGIKQAVKNFSDTLPDSTIKAYSNAKSKGWKQSVNDSLAVLRTRYTETYQAVATKGDDAKKLIDDFVQNPLDATKENVGHLSENMQRRYQDKFYKSYRLNVGLFLKANGVKFMDRVTSKLFLDGAVNQFDENVARLLAGGDIVGEFTDEALSIIKKEFANQRAVYDEFLAEAKDAGMKLDGLENYFPKLANKEAYSLVKNMDIEGIIKLEEMLAGAIFKKMEKPNWKRALSEARSVSKQFKEHTPLTIGTNEGLLEDMIRQATKSGASQDVLDDLADRLGAKYKDVSNRTRARVDYDFTDLEDFEATVSGVKMTITPSILFDMSSQGVFNRYTRSMAGHVAFRKMGYKSMAELDFKISKVSDDYAKKSLQDLKSIMLGDTLLDPSDTMNQLVSSAKNMAVGVYMVTGLVPMIGEALRVTLRSSGKFTAFKQTMKEFSALAGKDPDSELTKQIGDLLGHGNSRFSTGISLRGYTDVTNAEQLMDSKLVQTTGVFRDMVLRFSGMMRMHDVLSKIAMAGNADTLAQYLAGNLKLTAFQMEKYGITAKTMELLKGKLELTKIKNLKAIDMSGWTKTQKAEFTKVMDAMQERYIQNTSIGGSTLLAKNNSVGALLYTLLGYPAQAFANHGIYDARGALTGDLDAMSSTFLWFMGGYLSAQVKDTLNGTERSDDGYYIDRAFQNIPFLSGTGLIGSLTSGGVTPKLTNKMSQTVDDLAKIFGDGSDD
jgi:hypothetical protein